jgi:hypothetical protein
VIRYRLQCGRAHEFEAWFPSSDSYEAQATAARIVCPECGTRKVSKAIMAPNVAAARSRSEPPTAPGAPANYADLAREVRRVLVASSEDVGERFPEEARRIHYREARARAICGTACLEEARALVEEGIEIVPLPRVRGDAN